MLPVLLMCYQEKWVACNPWENPLEFSPKIIGTSVQACSQIMGSVVAVESYMIIDIFKGSWQ